ncbi:MAG: hypothetical protein WC107_00820 [Patescibacteria group bacterium]
MKEHLDNSELAQENFVLTAGRLISEMEKHQEIFSAGFSPGRGPTDEQRAESNQEWERLYTELINASIVLFREVGGQQAYTVWQGVCKTAHQKHSFDRLLNDDPRFIGKILAGSTEKGMS